MRNGFRWGLVVLATFGSACSSQCTRTASTPATQETDAANAGAAAVDTAGRPEEAPAETTPPSTLSPDVQKAWEGLSIDNSQEQSQAQTQDPAQPAETPSPRTHPPADERGEGPPH